MQISKEFKGHTAAIYSLSQSNDPEEFFSAGSDRRVARWNINSDEDGILIAIATDVIYSTCYLPLTHNLLIGQGKGEIHIVDLNNNKENRLLKLFNSAIFQIVLNEETNLLFILSGEGECCILNATDYSLIKRIKISSGKLRSIAFSSDNEFAVIGCAEGYVQLLNLNDLSLMNQQMIHEPGFSVNALAFSPDGKYILSGSRDAHLKITDTYSLKTILDIPAHNYAIYDIVYHESGNIFATASRDKTVKLWDADTFEIKQRLENAEQKGHHFSVNKLLWLKGNDVLLSAGDDKTIIAWNLQNTGLL